MPTTKPSRNYTQQTVTQSTELLRELVAHLRQNRTQLREEWANRITEALDHLAYCPRRYARCDDPTASVHGAEYKSIAYVRSCNPRIDGTLGPTRHRDSADSAAFANQIYDHPSRIAQLNVSNGERSGFTTTQATTDQNGE